MPWPRFTSHRTALAQVRRSPGMASHWGLTRSAADGARAVFHAGAPALTELRLFANPLTDAAMDTLRAPSFPSLARLDLGATGLTDRGV
jgi:hypothetical protein